MYCRVRGYEFLLDSRSDLRLVMENKSVVWEEEAGEAYVERLAAWEAEARPSGLSLDDVGDELGQNKMFWAGTDVHGHPTLWFQVRNHRSHPDGPDVPVQAVLYMIHHGIGRMRGPVEKFNLVFDLAGASRSSYDLSFFKKCVSAVGGAWPGRTFKIFILSPGFTMRMVWSVVRPFLPSRTLDRIKVLKNPVEDLRFWFDPHMLLEEYGGTSDAQYDYAAARRSGDPNPIALDLHGDAPLGVKSIRISGPITDSEEYSSYDTSYDETDNEGFELKTAVAPPLYDKQRARTISASSMSMARLDGIAREDPIAHEMLVLSNSLKAASAEVEQTELDLNLVRKRLDAVERNVDRRQSSRCCCTIS